MGGVLRSFLKGTIGLSYSESMFLFGFYMGISTTAAKD